MIDIKYEFIEDNTIFKITTKTQDQAIGFYIDTYCNRCAILDADKRTHDWYLDAVELEPYTEVVDGRYEYSIPASLLGIQSFSGLYIVSCALTDAQWFTNVAYDMDNLYCYKYQIMKQTCIPCDDIAKYNNLVNFVFAETLFKEAINLARYDDALGYYGTMLGIVGNCEGCSSGCDCRCNTWVKPKSCTACP